MTICHILKKVIILQSHLIRGEKEEQQLFYFWYTLSKNVFFDIDQGKNRFTLLFYLIILLLLQKVK